MVEVSGDGRFGYATALSVSLQIHVFCAFSLQIIADCLKRVWAFLIALDCGNNAGMPYLDV